MPSGIFGTHFKLSSFQAELLYPATEILGTFRYHWDLIWLTCVNLCRERMMLERKYCSNDRRGHAPPLSSSCPTLRYRPTISTPFSLISYLQGTLQNPQL